MGRIPSVQSMNVPSAASGVSPGWQPAEGLRFQFPQFLGWLRLGFGGAGLEGGNELDMHWPWNTWLRCLELFSSSCSTPAFPLPCRAGTAVRGVLGWAWGQCVCSMLRFQASPSQQTQSSPGVRRQVADGWKHRGNGRNVPEFPQQPSIQNLPGPDRFCTTLSPTMRSCGERAKECARLGASLRGKGSGGPAGSWGRWLLILPMPREQEGSAGEVTRETVQDQENPCFKPSENVWAQRYKSCLVCWWRQSQEVMKQVFTHCLGC